MGMALFCALAACGGSSGSDAGSGSDGGADSGPSGTPSPGVCTPAAGQTGNALNVGAYCTHGGGQCAQYGGAYGCSIDLSAQGGNFCILIGCAQSSDCGVGGCCTGESGNPIHACVPSGCVIVDGGSCPPIPGTQDAGPDGG